MHEVAVVTVVEVTCGLSNMDMGSPSLARLKLLPSLPIEETKEIWKKVVDGGSYKY